MKSAEGGVGITVFFEDGISDAKKKEIGAKIEARKEVREVKYVSADEAWKRYKETSLKPELVETFGNDNPLAGSDSYTVFVKKIENQAEVVNYISFLDGVRKVNSSGSTVSGFTAINSLVGIISVTIIGLLLSYKYDYSHGYISKKRRNLHYEDGRCYGFLYKRSIYY